jgi:ribose transport system substrate-binding protein
MQTNVWRVAGVVTAALALALFAAACGGSSSSGTSGNEGASQSSDLGNKAASAASAEGKKAGEAAAGGKPTTVEQKTIGFLALTQQAAAVKRATEGFEEAVKSLGWKVIVCEGNAEPQKLAACGSSLVAQNVDAIAEVAVEPAVVHQAMAEAKSKGIPWIDFGSQNTPNSLFTARMYVPEKALYAPLNEWLFEHLGENEEVGALTAESLSPTRLRYEGFQEDVAQHPGTKIAATYDINYSNPAKVTEGVIAMLRQHSNIGAIWSSADLAVIPAVQGFKQLGLSPTDHPLLVGPYPEANVLQNIREGWVNAEVDTPFTEWGWTITDELAQYFAVEKELTKNGKPAGYPAGLLKPTVITKENVTQEPNAYQPAEYDYVSYFNEKWGTEFSNVPADK